MSNDFTDEELAGLSEEERAAITAPEDDAGAEATGSVDDDPEFGKDVGPAAGTQPAAEPEKTEPAAAAADPAAAAAAVAATDPKAAVEPGAAAQPAEPAQPVSPGAFVPTIQVADVPDYATKMTELKSQLTEATKKYADGDLSQEDFLARQEAINEQRAELRQQHDRAVMAQTINEQTSQQLWSAHQREFFDQEASKALYGDQVMYAALNAAVINLAAKPENAGRSGAWMLKEADRMVRARFQPAAKPAEDPSKPKGDKPKDRKPDLSQVPTTLAQLPAAAAAETGTDEFAHLDNLSGIELENALARLTPDQEARYLRG